MPASKSVVRLDGGKAGTTSHRQLVAAQSLEERASHIPMGSLCHQPASLCHLLGSVETGLVHSIQPLFGYTLTLPVRLHALVLLSERSREPPCPQGPVLSQEAPVLSGPLSPGAASPQAQEEVVPRMETSTRVNVGSHGELSPGFLVTLSLAGGGI